MNMVSEHLSWYDLKTLKFVCKPWYPMSWKIMKERYFGKILSAYRRDVLLWSRYDKQPVQIKSVKVLQSGVYVTIKAPTPRGKILHECKVRMSLKGYMYISSNHLMSCHHIHWTLQMNEFLLKANQKAKWDAFMLRVPQHMLPAVPPSVTASLAHCPTLL